MKLTWEELEKLWIEMEEQEEMYLINEADMESKHSDAGDRI